MKYLSVREVAEAWEVSEAMIRKYCSQKRIPGAKQKGGVWVIPNTAKKPSSRMATSSRYEKLHPLACKLVRQKTKKNFHGLYDYVQINLTYSSSRMASNRLTRNQVESIFRKGKVRESFEPMKVSDLIEVLNHCVCVDYILDNLEKPLSVKFIILKNLMNRRDVTEVINACDAGREGELIFRNVFYLAECKKPMKRLWISSIDDNGHGQGHMDLAEHLEIGSSVQSCRLIDGIGNVCTYSKDDRIRQQLLSVFPDVQFVKCYADLTALEGNSFLVTEPLLQKALLGIGKEVFYPDGLMERQIRQVLECVSLAVSREHQEQHSFYIS